MIVKSFTTWIACLGLLAAGIPVATQPADTTGTTAPASDTRVTTAQTVAIETVTSQPAAEVSAAMVEARIREIQANTALSEESKKSAVDLLQQSLEFMKAVDTWRSRAETLAKSADGAPTRIAALKELLTETLPAAQPDIPATATVAMVEQAAKQAEADLAALQKQASDLRIEQGTRAARRTELPKLIAAARQTLDGVEKDIAAAPAASESPDAAAAQAMFLKARSRSLKAEIEAYEKEAASYEATGELPTLEADKLARDIARKEKEVTRLHDAVNERRRAEAGEAVREAQRARMEAANSNPAIKQLAEQNEKLAQRRTGIDGLGERIEKTQKALDEGRRTYTRLETRLGHVKKRVEAVGNTHAVGQLLRKALKELPDIGELKRQSAARADAIVQAQTDLMDFEDSRTELADLAAKTSDTLEAAGIEHPGPDVVEAALDLLKRRRTLIESLIADTNTWFSELIDLDTVQQQLLELTEDTSAFIGERILYIRSAPVIGLEDLRRPLILFKTILSPGFWTDVIGCVARDAGRFPGLYGPVIVLVACAFYYRRRLKRRLRANGELVQRTGLRTGAQSVGALILTLLIALPAPALISFLSWRLGGHEMTVNALAVGSALHHVAVYYYVLLSIYYVCTPLGIAEAHFRWPAPQLGVLRRNLRWFIPLTVTFAFLNQVSNNLTLSVHDDAPVRLMAMIYLATLPILFYRLLHPTKGALSAWVEANRGSWIERTRYIWFGVLIILPFAMMVACGLGYLYTVTRLLPRFLLSLLVLFWAAVIGSLFQQWIAIGQRSLAIMEARRRYEAMASQEPETVEGGAVIAEKPIDVTAVSAQVRRLLTMLVGASTVLVLYMINVEVMPALRVFDQVELWSYAGKISETVKSPDGTVHTQVIERLIPVTLGGLALALLMLVLTVSAMRNVPGFLEMVIFRRLALDSSIRYALTTVTSYVIIVVGTIITLGMVGVTWSSVQWLAAAVSVGLGFGLQEIFANFVSGLIILFERPIRVGDTITIGDMSGTVTSVHIRATTIRAWDGKDLLIPNKQVITSNVINWTLSDAMTRLQFDVGVEYGNDPVRVRELLLEVADSHPKVLKEPVPFAVFLGFGASSLDFRLYAYVSVMADRMPTTTEINNEILRRLGEIGVSIAFPTRTIHIAPPAEDTDSDTATPKPE